MLLRLLNGAFDLLRPSFTHPPSSTAWEDSQQECYDNDMKRKRNGKRESANHQCPVPSAPEHPSVDSLIDLDYPVLSASPAPATSISACAEASSPSPPNSYADAASSTPQPPFHSTSLASRVPKPTAAQQTLAARSKSDERRDKETITELKKKLAADVVLSRQLKQQLTRAEKELASLRQQRDHHSSNAGRLGAELASAKQDKADIERAFHELEKKHGEVEKALGEARSFLSLDDCGDLNLVITKLGDINDAVEQIAFGLAQSVPDSLRLSSIPSALEDVAKQRTTAGHPGVSALLQSVQAAGPVELDRVLYHILQVTLSEELVVVLFRPFHPSLVASEGRNVLDSMLQQLRRNGNRAQAAQWRAMSYSALEEITAAHRNSLPDSLYRKLALALKTVLHTLGASRRATATFVQPYAQSLERLVGDSLAWQRLIRQRYLSSDFDIICPFHSLTINNKNSSPVPLLFDGERMHDASAPTEGGNAGVEPKQVVAPLSIGLEQLKIKKEKDGTVSVEKKVLVKAEVWTERVGGVVAEQSSAEGGDAVIVKLSASGEATPASWRCSF